MKAVILAGGWGMRLRELTDSIPKPMIEVGEHPLLWHIMKTYSHYGINDFIICLGYRGHVIKDYFSNYHLHNSVVTFDMREGAPEVHENNAEPWRVTLVDTGLETMTGGRLQRIRPFLKKGESFCMTYGDGVGNIDIAATIRFHTAHKRLATVTAVRPPGRFGSLGMDGDQVNRFEEKPIGDGGWINGGFFVLQPEALDFIPEGNVPWEKQPLEDLARAGQLMAYRHDDFWQPMDTLRDATHLKELWSTGQAPWKLW